MLFTKSVTLTSTSTTTVFEVPEGYSAHINYLFLSNHGGSTNNMTAFVENDTDGDGSYTTKFYIFNAKPLTSKDYLELSDGAMFILHPTDRLRVASSAGGDVTALITLDLIYTGLMFNTSTT